MGRGPVSEVGHATAAETRVPKTRGDREQSTLLFRWLRTWVAVLVLFTTVVGAYLVIITSTLASINGRLATANRGVEGTGGNTQSLASAIERINGSLAAIDGTLHPIASQGDQIIAALTSINLSLAAADAAFRDTSSVLTGVGGQVVSLRQMMIDVDDPPNRLGVQNAHRRVAAINGVGNCGEFCNRQNFSTARADTSNILKDLADVNRDLNSICASVVGRVAEGANC